MYNINMLKNSKILIVEDEHDINRLIELVLLSDGYHNIKKVYDGQEALNIIKNYMPDLVLLDVMLPEIDGFTVCKVIKQDIRLKNIPIIMLTAKKMEEDIVKGFECGAIDYITKPFSNKILLARIHAHLTKEQNKILSYKTLVLNEDKRSAEIDNQEIKLTRFEFEILKLFIANVGKVYTRSQILEYLRGDDGFDISERAVDVQILNIRRKLDKLSTDLETLRGVGYRLKEPNNE